MTQFPRCVHLIPEMLSTCVPAGRELPGLGQELRDARVTTDQLFAMLEPGTEYDRPIAERHRIVFYIGHLEAFDWNLLRGIESSADLDRLFAFGIDPEVGRGPSDQASDWPAMNQVHRYVAERRSMVDQSIAGADPQLLEVAIEHRLMHAETLAYMFNRLERGSLRHGGETPVTTGEVPKQEMIRIEEGVASLGCRVGFGWDNEYGPHEVHVPEFRVARYKITNGDYLDFVREGAAPPAFWSEDGIWKLRGMFEDIPLPLDWPVYVSHDEAAAFARWKGMRLMSEAEFHRAAQTVPPPGNFGFKRWDPVPVQAGPLDARGIAQMTGNGWEWTSTEFAPFEGFEPFAFYPGYSANFFDGAHFVLKGASPRTAARLTRPSFRNWFRHDYPYAYTTFRLAEDC